MPGKKRFFLAGKGTFSGKKKSRCVKNKTKIGFFKERSFNFIPEKSTPTVKNNQKKVFCSGSLFI